MKWAGAMRLRVFNVPLITIDLYLPDFEADVITPADKVIKKFSRAWTEKMAK